MKQKTKQAKKFISSVLIVLLIIAPFAALSVIDVNADYGAADGNEWTFDEKTGTLTISGTAEIGTVDYNAPEECTWGNRSKVKNIIIKDGIPGIGYMAFEDCTGIENVTLPNTVTYVHANAFYGCSKLTNITIPDSVTTIGWYAFGECDNLTVECYENSAAHTYAVENEIPFELIDTVEKNEDTGISVTYSKGDIDGQDGVTAADARLALRASVGLENYEKGTKEYLAADVDKDGDITAADARFILRVSVGLEKLEK